MKISLVFYLDLDFVKTFLLTYQSFTTGTALLKKLIERYYVPRGNETTFSEWDKLRQTIQLRVCNVLVQWTKKYTADFVSPKSSDINLVGDLMKFAEEVLAEDNPLLAKQVRRNLLKLIESNEGPSITVIKHSTQASLGPKVYISNGGKKQKKF